MDNVNSSVSFSSNSSDHRNINVNNIVMEDISCINPDEFLNLDEFRDSDIMIAESKPLSDHQYNRTTCSSDLTPPLSPQPSSIIIDSSNYQNFRLIPITNKDTLVARKVKCIFPKPPTSSSDSDSNNPKNLDKAINKSLIKQQRLIRNRESAILSRNKKKEYVQTLEAQNLNLKKENIMLKNENSMLKHRLTAYSLLTCKGTKTYTKNIQTKNTTLMLAVLFMVSFNVVSILHLKTTQEPFELDQFKTRKLLFDDNSKLFGNETSANYTSSESEIYLNRTDDIRKVNIDNIRRWIPEPDIFNASHLSEHFSFKSDPLQDKLSKMYEKSQEQSQKLLKSKKRLSKKKKPVISPIQLYNSKMNVIKLNEFFDEFDRKDDTFYVFSFKADHLLLPANENTYNFSQIKMNLIMPRNNASSSSDKITMMQIETLIINTSLIQLTEKSIPENFLKPSVNSSSCNELHPNFAVDSKAKTKLKVPVEEFQPLHKGIKSHLSLSTIEHKLDY